MKRFLSLALAASMILVLLLSATGCSQDNTKVIRVLNWGDYIDKSVLDDFYNETGIKVIYSTFASNEELYVKLTSGGSSYDVIFPSDYMIERLASEGKLAKINFDNVPNFQYIDDRFKSMVYDPDNQYSVPYMWGTTGILYNTTMVNGDITGWSDLWDPQYAKKIFMYDSSRESIGVALLKLGYNMNSRDDNEIEDAKQALIEQKPLVLAYVLDDLLDKMVAGEAAIALSYSGYATDAMMQNPDLKYVIPKEGTSVWVDGMAIPADAENQEGAEAFIDYMCRTDIALKNVEEICYSTPQTEALEQVDDEMKSLNSFNPSEDELSRCYVMRDLGDYLDTFNRAWEEVVAN